MSLWQDWEIPFGEIQEVSKKFVLANCFDPVRAVEQFPDSPGSSDSLGSPEVRLLKEVELLSPADNPDTS